MEETWNPKCLCGAELFSRPEKLTYFQIIAREKKKDLTNCLSLRTLGSLCYSSRAYTVGNTSSLRPRKNPGSGGEELGWWSMLYKALTEGLSSLQTTLI